MQFRKQMKIDRQTLIRLVNAARDGDRQAFDELFARFQDSVYAVAYRRLRNEAEAQELCQEVFIRAMRKIHQLSNPAAFGRWLASITNRMAINRAVRARPCLPLEQDRLEASCREDNSPLAAVLAQERRDQLRVGLNRLTALDRDTLVAFYFHGRSLAEMSDQFHTPVGTIKRRLHVARKRLAKQLDALATA